MKKWISWIWEWVPKLFKKDLPGMPDTPPAVTSNTANTSQCECDLSGPLVCPLREHGNEAQVDEWLRNGGAPECGGTGMPIDVRFRLARPSGSYWTYAPFARSGLVTYADGKLTARCGMFEGQRYHVYYMSAHNQGVHMEGVPVVSGQAIPRDGLTFVYYECREK